MAIIDWPSTRPFAGALFSLGLDVSESAYTGFLTGNRTRRSNLADRLRGTLTLPPCADPVAGAAREALLLGLRSTGDLLRMAVPHRRYPLGTLRGAPVVSASAAAGARSFSIAGGTAGVNLLSGSGFEIDTNADGIADGWGAYSSGAVSGLTYARPAGNDSALAQQIRAATLGAAAVDQIGIVRLDYAAVEAGRPYSMAADVIANYTGMDVRLYVGWYTDAEVFLSASSVASASPLIWSRVALHGATAPPTAAKARLYVWLEAHSSGGGNPQIYVDNVQFEKGPSATTYAGLPSLFAGDFLGSGGNLLQVAYPGVTLTDAGAGTVPLTMPLQRALSSSAAVTWVSPAGLWDLDDDGLQLDYSAGVLQGGVAIPLRQVIA